MHEADDVEDKSCRVSAECASILLLCCDRSSVCLQKHGNMVPTAATQSQGALGALFQTEEPEQELDLSY